MSAVWVPRGFSSTAKIKDDDIQMIPVEAVLTARNELYDALPSGETDAFTLIKVIQAHIAKLDEILEPS